MMKYTKKNKREKGKSEQEIIFEFDWKVQLAIIFVIVLSILLFCNGRELIIPFFDLFKNVIN